MCHVDFDGDYAKVWNETPRRAAREHHCAGCGATIYRGETYLDHRSFSDFWWTEAGCFWCWWAREMFVEAHGRQSFVFSELESRLRECISENDDAEDQWRPVLAALRWRFHRSPSFLRKVNRRWLAAHPGVTLSDGTEVPF